MYCSTCGSRVADGRATCQVCGAAAARAPYTASVPPVPAGPLPMVPAAPSMYGAAQVQVCPRCGYRGMGTAYFNRGTHIALLVGSAVVLTPAAGLFYLLLRHNHKACPACGLNWGKHGIGALTLLPGGATVRSADVVLPVGETGGGGRGWAMTLLILGALFLTIGMAAPAFPPAVMGAMALAGSGLLFRRAKTNREERRDAIIQSLQLPVLQLAGRKGGRLTVTDVATEFGWPMVRAEKVLNSLDDGMRVMSDITDEGVIVYDFLEIRTAGLNPPRPELRLHA